MNSVIFYHIIMAFQHFAGKSLRVTDSADVLTDEEIETMLRVIRKFPARLRQEDPNEWPDLHRLAGQIESELEKCDLLVAQQPQLVLSNPKKGL